jgi:two-component system chemotaxis sensor kinase CheA
MSEDKDKNAPSVIPAEFTSEAEEIIGQIGTDLLALSSNKEELDPSILNSIFRSAHTLKGLSGMFSLNMLTEVSHNMENLLDALRLGKARLSDRLVDLLFESLDIITLLVKEGGHVEDDSQIIKLTEDLERALTEDGQTSQESILDSLNIKESILAVLTEYEEHRILEGIRANKNIYVLNATFSLTDFDKGLSDINGTIKDFGEVISTLPNSDGGSEGEIAFDLLVSSTKNLDFVEECLADSGATITMVSGGEDSETIAEESVEKDIPQETEKPKEEVELSKEAAPKIISMKSASQTVRVDISKLDKLMNTVGELLIAKSVIDHISEEVKSTSANPLLASALHKGSRDLGRKLVSLQEGLMEIRMVSLENLFDRLAVTVRKIAKAHAKEVDLKISGAQTKLDKLIVEEIGDPLMHLIRNAIDHGIEPLVLRKELGKPERGSIRLSANQRGNNVTVEIADDGAGIDKEKILRKARQKGLVPEDCELDDDEIMDLIFMPGFSTRAEISEISGRGVGMDVVKNNLSKISGHIDIESEKGKGSKITVSLPITLAILQAVIVETSSRIYAIPLHSVQESLLIKADDVETVEKREVLEYRSITLPLVRLEDVFGLSKSDATSEELYVVVVAIAQHKFGIVVDGVIGEQDIVIKSIGEIFSKIKGVAGATDLGNNETVLVLDVASIIEEISGG